MWKFDPPLVSRVHGDENVNVSYYWMPSVWTLRLWANSLVQNKKIRWMENKFKVEYIEKETKEKIVPHQ